MSKAKTKKWIAALIALFMVFSFVSQTKVFAESRIMNEVIIYDYLVDKMGFNCAAASGVLSNAYFESNFNPQEYGDRGTSYGLFQWHSGRMKNMMKYCDSNGYDYRTASGQMHYLEYELKRSYKTILNHMLAVENTPEGAYETGYYWCYYFEIPANREAKSVQRGKTAKNTYWERYREFGGKPLNSSNDFDMANYNTEFKRTLSPNNSGAADLDNLYIQLMLDKLGYKIDVDGVYGKNTAATVKRFQNDYGLDADGICDKNTWNAVKSASNGEIVPKCPLRIEEQPSDKTVYSGDKLTFVMKVVGTGLKYKWYTKKSGASNWTVWKEFTARTATATATDSWNGMQVRCVVTDRNGKKVESRTATVKLAVKPSITAHPQSVTAKTGDKLTFTVKAKGTGLRYQWYIKKPGTSSWSVWKEYTSSTATVKADDSWNGMQVRCVVTDVIGKKLESNAATVTLINAFAITAHPQSVTVKTGDKVTFTVKATGTGLSYQWYYKKSGDSDWSEWKGYTSATATSTANDSWNGMKVRCVVKDSSGKKLESNVATVTLINAFAITAHPKSVTVKTGDKVTFTVKATGTGLSYQWYYKKSGDSGWNVWVGYTSAAATSTANDSWNGMKVRCVVKDSSGKKLESNVATVTLINAFAITAHPKSVTAKTGDKVTFTVKATGTDLSYQWYIKKTGASDWTLWEGHTTATTSAIANDSWNGMKVRCVVKDSSGKKLESNTATVTLKNTLTITTQPQSVTAKAGDTVTFTVKATGIGLSYQWYVKKEGASDWTLWKGHTTAATSAIANDSWNGMKVRCVIKDSSGKKVESNVATVTLKNTLAITAHPQSVTTKPGNKVTFTVKATGIGLSYQWYVKKAGASDWTVWKGHTTATTSATANGSWDGMQVRCVVKDSSGKKVESNAAKVTLL